MFLKAYLHSKSNYIPKPITKVVVTITYAETEVQSTVHLAATVLSIFPVCMFTYPANKVFSQLSIMMNVGQNKLQSASPAPFYSFNTSYPMPAKMLKSL